MLSGTTVLTSKFTVFTVLTLKNFSQKYIIRHRAIFEHQYLFRDLIFFHQIFRECVWHQSQCFELNRIFNFPIVLPCDEIGLVLLAMATCIRLWMLMFNSKHPKFCTGYILWISCDFYDFLLRYFYLNETIALCFHDNKVKVFGVVSPTCILSVISS